MDFGFAAISTPPDVEFRFCGPISGSNLGNNLSVHALDDKLCAIAGRLFYRHDALEILESRASPRLLEDAHHNAAALALGLYIHLGARALARLEGDFALVVWDAHRRCFFARRDPLGAYPLFWTRVGPTVAVATGLKPLLDLLPSRALNLAHTAGFLTSSGMGWERPDESCAYQGVHRILPSRIVRLDADSGEMTQERCWHWPDRAVDPGSHRLEDIAPAYRERLQAAVRERIGSSTATQLSGGMDSTSVSLLALEALRDWPSAMPLHALALVYERLPSLRLERPYIDAALAAGAGGLTAQRVVGDDLLHFDSLIDPPMHEEPFSGLWCLRPEQALIGQAARLGTDSLLTGQGGDDLLDMLPYHLSSLIRQGRLMTAWNEACAWARARGSTPWRILQLCAAPPGDRRGLFQSLLFGATARSPGYRVASWINKDLVRRHAAPAPETEHGSQRARSATSMSRALAGIQRRVGDPHRWLLAAPEGIALSHPFLDARVICFGLGMQQRYRPDPAQIKPVLAAGMRDLLPEAIRTRRDKRSFNEVYYLGLSRNQPALRRLIEAAPVDDLLDKKTLIDGLGEVALGRADFYQERNLDTTLSLIAWLTRQEAWQRRHIDWRCVFRLPSGRLVPQDVKAAAQ
jgi:asparagine synthase (glutamine-hydrolysing)